MGLTKAHTPINAEHSFDLRGTNFLERESVGRESVGNNSEREKNTLMP